MKILFATRNQGKVNEVRQFFGKDTMEVVTLNEVCPELKITEDGATFAENACKKARTAFARTGMWTLGEDSGLEIDALDGRPGIMSARFLGEKATDLERNRRILAMMVAVPEERRSAHFRCVVCLVEPHGKEQIFEGICKGKIAPTIRGIHGFGYDPIFVPEGYTQTFAELGQVVKNRISHRARAFQKVLNYLQTRLSSVRD